MDDVHCRRQDGKIMELSDESLLVEILCRFPSRAAIRFKLLCKRWCSLISSDYFITFFNHRRHDPSLPPIHHPHPSSSSFIFQFQHQKHFSRSSGCDPCLRIVRCGYTHHDADLCGVRKLDLSFLPGPKHKILLKASCSDLILCSIASSRTLVFYICNHITMQWVALPPARVFWEVAVGFLCVPASCSLCPRGSQWVDNSRYNFMVVRIFSVPNNLLGVISQFKVELFSSEEGLWKTLVVSSPRALIRKGNTGESLVPYNGMLHWVFSMCILVYDPFNFPERFLRVIDLPPGVHSFQCFGEFQGRLRVTLRPWNTEEDNAYNIWELEDYNIGKWSLVHKIYITSLKQLLAPDVFIKVIGLVQIDGNVFYSTESFSMWLGNVPSGRMDHQYELIHHRAYRFGLFRDNVFWIGDQCWPTPVPLLPYTINSKNLKEEVEG